MPSISKELSKIKRFLGRKDAVLKRLMAAVGPCTLQYDDREPFGLLARSIIAQQISSKAAISIGNKLSQLLGAQGINPANVLRFPADRLREAGLSANKAKALCDLAEKVQAGQVPLKKLHRLEDEEVIEHLTPVYGIGRWTAEMFLIFCLGRLDVLPVADLGLRMGAKREYDLPEPPGKNELIALGESWRPYRTIATWYFWRSFGPVPQS